MARLSITLSRDDVSEAKKTAKAIVDDVFHFITKHTTDTIERTVLRYFGVDGVDAGEAPLPNVVVDHLKKKGVLDTGSAYWISNACVATGKDPQTVAEAVGANALDLTAIPSQPLETVYRFAQEKAVEALDRVESVRKTRDELLVQLRDNPKPYKYVIVATGNIYEDVSQAKAASEQGADVSQSFDPPPKAYWTTFRMVLRPKALAARTRRKKTFGSCVKRSMKSPPSRNAIFG